MSVEERLMREESPDPVEKPARHSPVTDFDKMTARLPLVDPKKLPKYDRFEFDNHSPKTLSTTKIPRAVDFDKVPRRADLYGDVRCSTFYNTEAFYKSQSRNYKNLV
jgi:hypothetical protein